MNDEIEIRDDHMVNYSEIQDGEGLCLQVEGPEGVTDEIILIRPIALKLAKIINEIMGNDEEEKQASEASTDQ
jgi:hypothetical protein